MSNKFNVNIVKDHGKYEYYLCSATNDLHYCQDRVGYDTMEALLTDYIVVCMFIDIISTIDTSEEYGDRLLNDIIADNPAPEIKSGIMALNVLSMNSYEDTGIDMPVELWLEYETLQAGRHIISMDKISNITIITDLHNKFINDIKNSKYYKDYVKKNGKYEYDDISLFWKR